MTPVPNKRFASKAQIELNFNRWKNFRLKLIATSFWTFEGRLTGPVFKAVKTLKN